MFKCRCFLSIIALLFFLIPVNNSGALDNQKDIIHTVVNGDNLFRISLKYNVSQQDIMSKNNMQNTNIFIGQKLIIPNVSVEKQGNTSSTNKQPSDLNNQTTTNNTNTTNNANNANNNVNRVVDTTKIQPTNTPQNIVDYTTFIWPVRGSIMSKFGHLTNSGKLEGVNIGTEKGSIVRASSSGEVVYNDKVEGYDNVILIRHYNGFITAYGHTDPLVVVGDKIKKGQVIAYVTQNNNSKRSILYFSIRKNKQSYDPEKIIPVKISE